MFNTIKHVLAVFPLFLVAFSSISDAKPVAEKAEDYYHNLRFLKDSDAPKIIRVINMDNVAHNKPMVERGILVTYKNRYAKHVAVAGDFSNWKLIFMNRGKYGVWYYLLKMSELEKDVMYKFNVDGIWINDFKNTDRRDDGYGSYVSVINKSKREEGTHLTYHFIERDLVEFRLYKPGAKLISLVGDFNNWNPESDLLEKDKKGIWRLRKRLASGIYKYMYIVDGEWIVDLYNEISASDGMGGTCSVIIVK